MQGIDLTTIANEIQENDLVTEAYFDKNRQEYMLTIERKVSLQKWLYAFTRYTFVKINNVNININLVY